MMTPIGRTIGFPFLDNHLEFCVRIRSFNCHRVVAIVIMFELVLLQ
jgi:hypothetical protein